MRKFKPTDLVGLIDMFTDAEVMRYIGPRRAMTEDETEEWLSNILRKQDVELTRYAVALKATDDLIGVAGLHDEDEVKDFGYYFRRSFWGQGYAQEACSAIINYIETTLQIRDYQIFIADENMNSIKMIKKLGMRPMRSIKKSGEQGHLYKSISYLREKTICIHIIPNRYRTSQNIFNEPPKYRLCSWVAPSHMDFKMLHQILTS